MANEYHYGPENQEPQGGSGPNWQGSGQPGPGQQEPGQQGYHYAQYNQKRSNSTGSGQGTASPSGYRPSRQDNDMGEWIAIAVLFMLPFGINQVIALIWLIRKLMVMDKNQKRRYKQEAQKAAAAARDTVADLINRVSGQPGAGGQAGAGGQPAAGGQAGMPGAGSYRYGQAAQPGQTAAQPAGWNAQDPAEIRRRSARRQASADSAKGKGLIIGGGIVSAIFALGAAGVSMDILRNILYGHFWPDDLVGLLAVLMFLAGGLGMLFSGFNINRRGERYLNYLAYIGANREVPLAHMAASFGVSVSALCKDLRRMLAKGILPTGYLDLAEGKLYLTEMGYHAPEPRREAPPQETAQEAAAREDDILREIRQVNDAIPDAVMSAKIDRIEEITGKILKYQKEHPNKEGQLRSFLNYYLPTTLKILRAYAQLDAQGIEGENISAAKKRIEDMMDQVVYGFERQLDKLFQDDAMDIASDVEVLENMLRKDGLSDEGGISMTL